MNGSQLKIFVCGDVMTGRGIDQVLLHPCEPQIYESYIKDARDYVKLAERKNGAIPRRAPGSYLWKDAFSEWQRQQPELKVVNLETAITKSSKYWPGKMINYRMHPMNIDALTSAQIDICSLANNHILDWHEEGLIETIDSLRQAQIQPCGAGSNLQKAQKPAEVSFASVRVLVFSMSLESSGVPSEWGATDNHVGLYLLKDLSPVTISKIRENVDAFRNSNELIIFSIHWGSNWGYEIPSMHQEFAHRLIDEVGGDVIYGHSSHHPLGIEIYKNKPILYGCGDFINDYEGIGGMEQFRGDLSIMYFLTMNSSSCELEDIELVPLQIKNFQLHYAAKEDCLWLAETLNRESATFGTKFYLENNRHRSIRVKM